jgi:putative transposase
VLNGNGWMSRSTTLYKRHQFSPEIIQYAVWLYHRCNLSHRDIEDLLAERGVVVSYESMWRAVDQDGEIVDVFLQRRRNGKGAKRFFKRLMKTYRNEPQEDCDR